MNYCRKCNRCRFNPWVRKIPWRRAWQPTPVVLPGDPWMEEPGWLQSMGSQESVNLTDNPTSTRIQVCVCTMSCPTLYDPMTLHGSPCLPPGDHPNSGIKPTFLALAGRFFISSTTWEAPPPPQYLNTIIVRSHCFGGLKRANPGRSPT